MEEKSAGAVVFKDTPKGREYLLLQNGGRWDFPKGGVEKGETDLQTVVREVSEETGMKNFKIIPGFKRIIEYFYRRDKKNIHKQVVYMLARAGDEGVKISFEHQGFGWFTFKNAVERASYDNSKNILADAEKFVSSTRPTAHN